MRFGTLAFVGLILSTAVLPQLAKADQPRDWYLAVKPEGNFLTLDVIMPAGGQATFENRRYIYGKTNELVLKANAIATWPFSGAEVGADLRLVVLTLGASAGVRNVWRNFAFDEGQPIHRKERRQRDGGGEFDNALFGFGELRTQLSLPINEHVLLNSIAYFRFEDSPDRSYDWQQAVVRDGGFNLRWETQLFFKHKSFGGIGPVLQVLNYPLDGRRDTLVNVGAAFVTRPGFSRRDDLIFLQALVNPADDGVYGTHIYRAPLTLLLVYRSVLTL